MCKPKGTNESVEENKCNFVPIFPIRYTVVEKKHEAKAYSYHGETNLEKNYPELKHSQYTTRLLREGFVYLYDANKEPKKALKLWKVLPGNNDKGIQFQELTSLTSIPEEKESGYKLGETHAYISGSSKSDSTYIYFTDTLWTKATLKKIAENNDFRNKLMVKINLKEWTAKNPDKNTFSPEKVKGILEEYRDKDWKKNLSWSKRVSKLYYKKSKNLENAMGLVCKHTQIVVALYDNIGLVEDQKMLIHKKKDDLSKYLEVNHREKLIAELIEQTYKREYVKQKGIKTQKELDESINEVLGDRLQFWNKLSANASNIDGQENNTPIPTTSSVLGSVAKRNSIHVNEKKRLKFLLEYKKKFNALLKIVIEVKNDRCELLKTYTQTGKQTYIGTSFLTYDTKNPISGGAHAQSFASIIEGMKADVSIVSGIKNCEHELFDEWWQKEDNPQMQNLTYDDKLFEHMMKDESSKTELKKLFKELSPKAISAGHTIASAFSPFFATSVITQNLLVDYKLSKSPKWNGAALNNIDRMFQRSFNIPTEAQAKKLRALFEGNHKKVMELTGKSTTGKYKENTIAMQMSPKDYIKKFGFAAGAKLSDESVEGLLQSSGSLKKGEKKLFTVLTTDEAKLKYKLENPFGGRVTGSITCLSLIYSYINLKNAIDMFFEEDMKLENGFNLASAAFGIAGDLNAMLIATRPLVGTSFYSKYVIHKALENTLKSIGVSRFLGYGGAICESISVALKGLNAHKAGDTDAAGYYAVSSLALLAGGIVITESSISLGVAIAGGATAASVIPVAGWIVAGVLLTGLGIWALLKGDDALDTDIEKWLDRCSFARDKKNNNPFKTETEEHEAFVKAFRIRTVKTNNNSKVTVFSGGGSGKGW